MHENNFENQIQDKMDQLGFDPSDGVWVNVDKVVRKVKKRRVPLFWLFILSGLLLLGGGYYLTGNHFSGMEKKPALGILADQPLTIPKPGLKLSTEKNTSIGQVTNPSAENKYSENPVSRNAFSRNGIKPGTVQAENSISTINVIRAKKKSTVIVSDQEQKILSADIAALKNGEKDNATNSQQPTINGQRPTANDQPPTANRQPPTANRQPPTANDQPPTANDQPPTANDQPPASSPLKKKHPWVPAVSMNAGFSNINQGFLEATNVSYATNLANTGSNTAGNYTASEINSGFSFGADIWIKRQLSNRISLTSGIGYHYYSTKIQVGNYVNSAVLYAGAAYPLTPAFFYTNGKLHSYTNQYHFLELPVNIQFELVKSDKIPVFWEAGLMVSWLLHTNALNFDTVNNYYYQDHQLFNKTQFSVNTAILMGFHIINTDWQIGPQFQYGLSSITKSGGDRHLFYGGLKLVCFPWKNK